MKRSGNRQGDGSFCSGILASSRSLFNSLFLAGNNDLTRRVKVGWPDTLDPSANLFNFSSFPTNNSGHGSLANWHSFLHKLTAEVNDLNRISKLNSSSRY